MPPEICPACGAQVPRNAKACPECGSDGENFDWEGRDFMRRVRGPRPFLGFYPPWSCVIMLILFALAAFFLFVLWLFVKRRIIS